MTSWVRLSTPFARKIEAKAMALQAIQAALQPHNASPAVLQPEEPPAPPAAVSVEPWPPYRPAQALPFEKPVRPQPLWRTITEDVAARHGFTFHDLVGTGRGSAKLVAARHEAISIVKTECRVSSEKIGVWFGNRDHTTILHAIKRHAERNALALPASSDVR